ncbi:MAG: class I SAM-dependent methyltransferase [Myxococcota bacterium]
MVVLGLGLAGATSLGCASGGAHPHHASDHMERRFDDAEHWATVFDAPDRDAWQRPDVVVAALVARPDLRVVDLGAGTGYFTMRFARALPAGSVVAADIEPTLLEHTAARAAHEGLGNVATQLGQPDDPALGAWAGTIDLLFVCDTYHHLGERVAYFRKVRALLAPGGRVAIVDFLVDSPRGPPREHKIAPEQVVAELGEAGFDLVRRHPDLPDQYLLELAARP